MCKPSLLAYYYLIVCHCRCLVVIPTFYGSTIIICIVKFGYKVGSGVGFVVGSIVWCGLDLQEKKTRYKVGFDYAT